jgi:hypothetical protein
VKKFWCPMEKLGGSLELPTESEMRPQLDQLSFAEVPIRLRITRFTVFIF